jgi:uncharacterized protein (TIGR02444 family)
MATPPVTASGNPQSAFWQFSLAFYARPQVAGACLELQDQAGIDVNLLLYLLFLATHHRQVGRDDVARIDGMIAAWREQVVLPLRNVRRQLKPGIPPCDPTDTDLLRGAVKRIELDAERIEQETIERLAAVNATGRIVSSRRDAARANLAAYEAFIGALSAAPLTILLDAFTAHGS